MKWSAANIPDQSGRVIIITGANSGIGFWMAKHLAQKGARIIMACRSEERAKLAQEKIINHQPDAKIDIEILDLASLKSVKGFSEKFHQKHDRLDILINNAGVMMTPKWETEDGFEYQIGINHLGHFALTNQLLSLLEKTENSRVVSLSSMAHKSGKINLDDLNWKEKKYSRWKAYAQSKLANLMFAINLDRKLQARNSTTRSLAAHPGMSRTKLGRYFPLGNLAFTFTQAPKKGALPALRAATDPEATEYPYWGPRGIMEAVGYPKKATINKKAINQNIANEFWKESETLTKTSFPEASGSSKIGAEQ
ncbi:MAG: oxidoreductase [Candidatus Poseidoniales archaeon]|jgi:NAD(P)-dependent dehydrogenase (short-subunit alcohol dehydrogenase family)|tara:strand:+ start:100 stop:1026 length:927 start_codon:yes stop_codon:yes gene_type:complete